MNWFVIVMKLKIKNNEFEILDMDQLDEFKNPKAKIHLHVNDWHWFIVAAEEIRGDYNCFGLVKGFVEELGFFTLHDVLESGAELDTNFTEIGIYDLKEKKE